MTVAVFFLCGRVAARGTRDRSLSGMQFLREVSTRAARVGVFTQPRPKADMSGPLLLRCTALTCYTSDDPWVWGERDEAARLHGTARRCGGVATRGIRAAGGGAGDRPPRPKVPRRVG